ncbi:nuclear transport factor 2 family protein [Leucobacter sp. CSA1]|uniref:Nuclear transport factor 2 family protein n=1 Tax=Leucobacter chromiisoli TaxID=2796471 RepID=A0A934UVX4_9MICO|nr:nuclear transport factor 2 family protein [Leucobacter chromiisoli]MBK0419673.1 nuclear transport factor 2 family protein [Leucobacter chromiisoli]
MRTPAEESVLAAADAIVAAFAATDTAAYFAGFSPDASFVFHPEPARLNSRAEYEELWRGWLESGWRVTACESSERLVQTFPGGAVFSHTVATSIDSAEGPDSYVERESIVFRVDGDDLLAVHEHLSTVPDEIGARNAAAAQAGEERDRNREEAA